LRIAQLEKLAPGRYQGFVLQGRICSDFQLSEDGLSIALDYPLRPGEEYTAFAARMGKFFPYRSFLAEPIDVDDITQRTMADVWAQVEGFYE
jgi:hypothetical protein